MNKRQLIAGALGTALLVSALPGLAFAQDEEMTYAAEDVQWALGTLAGEPVPEDVEVTMLLSGGEVNGSAGCNSYFGNYEIDEAGLTFPEPFGVTAMICEGPQQETEDAYLPLLQTTAGWVVDDEGMLHLSDAEGTEILVYGQPPVDITATDIATLTAELESLQMQIDEASEAVDELIAAAESVNVKKITNRIAANEDSIAALEKKTKGLNVDNLKSRIKANEEAIASLTKQVNNLKNRVKALEENDKVQDERLTAIEEAIPVPEQPLP